MSACLSEGANTMPTCSAVGCTNRSGFGNYSLFAFPVDKPELRRQWIHNCGRITSPLIRWTPTRYSALCSIHFDESCFETNYYESLMGKSTSKRRRKRSLKPSSVPMLFEHTKAMAKTARQLSVKRADRAAHAEVSKLVLYII